MINSQIQKSKIQQDKITKNISNQGDSSSDSLISFMSKKLKQKESDIETKNKAINKLKLKISAKSFEDELDEDEKLEEAKKLAGQKTKFDIRFLKIVFKEIISKYLLKSFLLVTVVFILTKLIPVIIAFFGSGIHHIFRFLFSK